MIYLLGEKECQLPVPTTPRERGSYNNATVALVKSIEALDHVVFHYEARVSEGGPANADHSSLERLPADLRQLRTVRIASL